MARLTVEDCIDKVNNRFELVLYAAYRARALFAGEALLVDRDNDKNPVVALREIADGKLSPEKLEKGVITNMQSPDLLVDEENDFESKVRHEFAKVEQTAPSRLDEDAILNQDVTVKSDKV